MLHLSILRMVPHKNTVDSGYILSILRRMPQKKGNLGPSCPSVLDLADIEHMGSEVIGRAPGICSLLLSILRIPPQENRIRGRSFLCCLLPLSQHRGGALTTL